MQSLPSSIEAYLQDAGFSTTELLILKNLLEHDALTTRQIASKTGKSPGVLDQAMKKLIRKKIVKKEWINDNWKYTLISLDAVSTMLHQDTNQKREELLRRHENFESYVASLKVDKTRPDMQHFEGEAGMKQAYMRLLDKGKEMLRYLPVQHTVEEDPLRDFFVEYFRERRTRNIFERVIAHDTPLGRRFASRDPFEYRKTFLISQEECSFSYEKIITGDTIACFNHVEKRACLIDYPEMAGMEKVFFEKIWREKIQAAIAANNGTGEQNIIMPEGIPIKTRLLSGLRGFFLTKRSIGIILGLALFAAGLTYGIQRYTDALNMQRMKEKIISVATTGVLAFDPKDIEALQVEADWKKPEWQRVVSQLKEIRISNADILFAYIFRKSKTDPSKIEFVADSHSINPYANSDADTTNDVDVNSDGKIDSQDYLQWPGQIYTNPPLEALEGYNRPLANKDFYQDNWGKVISGYAPIKDKEGNVIAVMAADMRASDLSKLSSQTFLPLFWFFALFIFLIFIRLTAFNRSLLKECMNFLKNKKLYLLILIISSVSLLVIVFMYFYTLKIVKNDLLSKLKFVSATAAMEFQETDINALHFAKDMKLTEYQKVFNRLNEIRNQDKNIRYVYIMRPTEIKDVWEFVADADSNYNLPFSADYNLDGKIDDTEENVAPGIRYVSPIPQNLNDALRQPVAYDSIFDQWGKFVSGIAPIKNSEGNTIGIIEIDMYTDDLYGKVRSKFIVGIVTLFTLSALLALAILLIRLGEAKLNLKKYK